MGLGCRAATVGVNDKLLHSPPSDSSLDDCMIHSMTAFARESAATDLGVLTVELRSVNHRYLDCTFKLPDNLRPLELQLREMASAAMARGKLDCLIRIQANSVSQGALNINSESLDKLVAATAVIRQHMPEARQPTVLDILQFPGVCGVEPGSEEHILEATREAFKVAVKSLVENRSREGQKLKTLLLARLDQVKTTVDAARKMLPQLLQQQRERIVSKIEDLDLEPDNNRLEQELVYIAQKADIDEELDRLDAHIGEVRHTLEKGGPCGRRLDFLMQELNREANTLSSKSIASSVTQSAVELKVLIEQMREQIQNIE
ncbi:MAG: YicC/YloC family endoribonuclease [Pseudomonadota bacterium]